MKYSYWLAGAILLSQQAIADQGLDKLISQWTSIEQQTNQIENQWRVKKALLNQRKRLLEQEKKQLKLTLNQHATGTDEVEQERQALLERQQALEKTQKQRIQFMQQLSNKLARIALALPPVLSQQWQREISQISQLENPSEKLEKQLALLTQLSKFNQQIGFHQTAIVDSNGDKFQVEQIFLGAGRGWYVSKDGKRWARGESRPEGWVWLHQDSSTDPQRVKQAIDVYKNQHNAKLLELNLVIGEQG